MNYNQKAAHYLCKRKIMIAHTGVPTRHYIRFFFKHHVLHQDWKTILLKRAKDFSTNNTKIFKYLYLKNTIKVKTYRHYIQTLTLSWISKHFIHTHLFLSTLFLMSHARQQKNLTLHVCAHSHPYSCHWLGDTNRLNTRHGSHDGCYYPVVSADSCLYIKKKKKTCTHTLFLPPFFFFHSLTHTLSKCSSK